ncbi:FAD:protein FMN transferase [Ampullimonas aquatilis]|uniref:FAD:protein FMN transferase n=1 Tax=Ampullimonas aquatilis TaxID=1341549 RepID=UPI003C7418F1
MKKTNTSRRFFLNLMGQSLLYTSLPTLAANNAAIAEAKLFDRSGLAFGTTIKLTLAAQSGQQADAAFEQAFTEIEAVQQAASLFRPHSEISQLNRNGVLKQPSTILQELLQVAAQVSTMSRGAFDITVQPLWLKLDQQARQSGNARLDAATLSQYRQLIDWHAVQTGSNEIRLSKPGMGITLNGLTQGYAADRVAAILKRNGIEHAFLDTGEINMMGHKPNGRDWVAAIQDPRHPNQYVTGVSHFQGSLSTSGDYEYFWDKQHQQHHILDPHSGTSPTELASVTVATANGAIADGLSTAIMVLGSQEGMKLIKQTEGVEAFMIRKDGSVISSAGFPKRNLKG